MCLKCLKSLHLAFSVPIFYWQHLNHQVGAIIQSSSRSWYTTAVGFWFILIRVFLFVSVFTEVKRKSLTKYLIVLLSLSGLHRSCVWGQNTNAAVTICQFFRVIWGLSHRQASSGVLIHLWETDPQTSANLFPYEVKAKSWFRCQHWNVRYCILQAGLRPLLSVSEQLG